MSIFKEIQEAIVDGSVAKVKELTEKSLSEGIQVGDIVNDAFIPGMDIIGTNFKNGDAFVPEMLMAARAMQAGMQIIKPLIADAGVESKGTVVVGTVKGDLHDIGKNLVAMMLEGAGFKIIDLGIDVSVDKFVQAVEEHKPEIVALSALLTTTLDNMRMTVEKVKAVNENTKIIIGGAPVSQNFADEIGAHAYAADAAGAVDMAREVLNS